MEENNQHLEALTEIRSLMEKSSRFLSLSGLSGVCAGVFALIGAGVAFYYINTYHNPNEYYFDYAYYDHGAINTNFLTFFFVTALSVLVLSLAFGSYFTMRKAKRNNLKVWDATSKRLLTSLMIPLVSGGAFCLILVYHGIFGLIAPVTLIFYGLALLNASKYTFNEIRYLGISEILLGLVSSVMIGYGLYFWAFGFGILHIVYGSVMYFKYEKK